MSKFNVTVTKMTANDTIERFETKVKAANLDATKIATFLHELDCKEGVWGIERCSEIREYLEKCEG